MSSSAEPADIQGKFGFVGITAYIVGLIIGSGIFITSNLTFISVGSWGATITVWTVCGAMTVLGALSWAELAAAYPRQGGTYIYILRELGHFPAFLYIITRVLLLNPVSQAINGLAIAQQIQIIFAPCPDPLGTKLMACSFLLLMTWMQTFQTNFTSSINTVITGAKVLTLVGIIVSAVVYVCINSVKLPGFMENTTTNPYSWVGAFNGCYWSYAGWQAIPAVMEEIKNPKKTFPRAVITGVGTVTVIYVLTNFAFILVLSPQEIKSSTFIVSTFAASLSGYSLDIPFTVLVVFSLLGSFLAFGLVSGRYMFSASREGDLPRFLSLLHWELNTPIPAQTLHMLLSMILVLSTDKIQLLLRLFVFISIGFDLFVLASLLKLKYRTWEKKTTEDRFQVSVVVPCVYSAFIAAIFVTTCLNGELLQLIVPLIFLTCVSGVYVVFIHYKWIRISFAALENLMYRAFLLVPVSTHSQ